MLRTFEIFDNLVKCFNERVFRISRGFSPLLKTKATRKVKDDPPDAPTRQKLQTF